MALMKTARLSCETRYTSAPAVYILPMAKRVVALEDGLAALTEAGRRLLALDRERFQRVLALCRAYVSVYEDPGEDDAVVLSRRITISPRNPKASA